MQFEKLLKTIIIVFSLTVGCYNKNLEKEVHLYYDKIHLAEMFIVHEKYDSALAVYETAFLCYDSPWGLDYYNALLCSAKIGKYNRAVQLVDSCIKRGISIDYLKNDYLNLLNDYFSTTSFLSHYDSLHNAYLTSFDTTVINTFELSIKNDQKLVSNVNNPTDYYDLILANVDTLEMIIKNKKIPHYPYKYQQYPRMDNLPWITLRHYFGLRNSIRNQLIDKDRFERYYNMKRFYDNKFEELIKKQIQLGIVNPVMLSSTIIYNHKHNNMYGERGYVRIRDDLFAKNVSQKLIEKISKNRNDILLEDFNDYRTKYKYLQDISDSIGAIPRGMFRFRVNHHCVTHLAKKDSTREFLVEEFKQKGYIKL